MGVEEGAPVYPAVFQSWATVRPDAGLAHACHQPSVLVQSCLSLKKMAPRLLDSSLDKVTVLQAWRPESRSQESTYT